MLIWKKEGKMAIKFCRNEKFYTDKAIKRPTEKKDNKDKTLTFERTTHDGRGGERE